MNDLTIAEPIAADAIRSRILTIRGVQVILDRDLAELYGVTTGALNQAVKRNKNRSSETEKEGRFATVPDSDFEREGEKATGIGSILFAVMLFAAVCTAALAVGYALLGSIQVWSFVIALVVAALAASALRIASQWEKVVVLRLGKFNRIVGPGPFFVVPIVESCAMRVDTRVRVTTFGAEETLTNDLVPLDVDAVLFWMVWDAKAARATRPRAQGGARGEGGCLGRHRPVG